MCVYPYVWIQCSVCVCVCGNVPSSSFETSSTFKLLKHFLLKTTFIDICSSESLQQHYRNVWVMCSGLVTVTWLHSWCKVSGSSSNSGELFQSDASAAFTANAALTSCRTCCCRRALTSSPDRCCVSALCQSQQSRRGGGHQKEAVQRCPWETFCGGSSLHRPGWGGDQPLQGGPGQRWDFIHHWALTPAAADL